jgi:uncharacterized Tic20 family protein
MNNGYNPVTKDERLWATFCHLSGLLGFIVPFIGQILGPLIIWLIKRDESPFVDDQGREALNFQITVTIIGIIFVMMIFVVIGLPLLLALMVFWVVFMIIAAVNSNDGLRYRYPLVIRFF